MTCQPLIASCTSFHMASGLETRTSSEHGNVGLSPPESNLTELSHDSAVIFRSARQHGSISHRYPPEHHSTIDKEALTNIANHLSAAPNTTRGRMPLNTGNIARARTQATRHPTPSSLVTEGAKARTLFGETVQHPKVCCVRPEGACPCNDFGELSSMSRPSGNTQAQIQEAGSADDPKPPVVWLADEMKAIRRRTALDRSK